MRLTLRTLLAYLDSTLDAADLEALGEKVRSSSIATELADRIRRVTGDAPTDTPSPTAVGPTDDANAIAEYLDDTLAPELTADVERQCVSSEAQLAEVAACHQILTIALGEKAVVPTELRQRVYAVPGTVPGARQVADSGAGAVPDASSSRADASGPTSVTPVGPEDSGVAEATTRLAAEPDLGATLSAATKIIRKQDAESRHQAIAAAPVGAQAGDRTRERLEAIGPLLSGGRPSRVAPLLVALGLAAAFLFVVTQAFRPLMGTRGDRLADRQADVADESDSGQGDQTDANLIPADPDEPRRASGSQPPAVDNRSDPAVDPTTPPSANNSTRPDGNEDAQPPARPRGDSADTSSLPGAATTPLDGAASDAPAGDGETSVGPAPVEDNQPAEDPVPGGNSPSPDSDSSGAENGQRGRSESRPPVIPENPLDVAERSGRSPRSVGLVLNDGGLLMVQDAASGQWNRLQTDAPLEVGSVVYCAPTYSASLQLNGGVELRVVGPTAMRIDQFDQPDAETNPLLLTVDFGRLVLIPAEAPMELMLATPAASGSCQLTRPDSRVAISVAFQRGPGTDPLDISNSRRLMDLVALGGPVGWTGQGAESNRSAQSLSIRNGQFCRLEAAEVARVMAVANRPGWIDAALAEMPAANADSLAQEGLAELFAPEVPVEQALRGAIGSDRQEVSALAARTLLHLGMPDVYFGPNGVLNLPQHLSMWPVLVGDLRAVMDRGPASAAMVGAAIGELEGEAAGKIWGLLVGMAPEQLQRGGDAILIDLMDDPAMAVRVVATETLRETTGKTLAYRPDFENPTRRNKIITDLRRLQRRDQIRWFDQAVGVNGVPRIDGSDRLVPGQDSGR